MITERYHLRELMSQIQWVSLKDQEEDYLLYFTMRELGFTLSFAYFVLLRWLYLVLPIWPMGLSLAGFGFSFSAFFLRLFQDIIRISFQIRLGNSYNYTFFYSLGYSLTNLPVDYWSFGLKLAGQTGQTSIQSSSMKTKSSPMLESPWFSNRTLMFYDWSSLLKVFSISYLSYRNLMTFGSFGCSCSSSPILHRISPLNSLKILTFLRACISSSSCLDLSSWRQVSIILTTTSKMPMRVVTTARQKQVIPMLIMVVWPQSLRLQSRMSISMVMMQMSLMNLMMIFILLLQVRATTRQNWKARCRLFRIIKRQIWMSPGKMLSRHKANISFRQQLKTQQMQVTFWSIQLSCIRSQQISTLALFYRLEQMQSTIINGKTMMIVETRIAKPQIHTKLGRSKVTCICQKAQYMHGSSNCSRLSWMVMNLRMEIFLASLRVSFRGMYLRMRQMMQLMTSREKTEMKAVMIFLQKFSPLQQYRSLAGPQLSKSSGTTFCMLWEYSQGKRLSMLRNLKQSMLQSKSLKTIGMVSARYRCASINCYSQKRMVTRLLQPPLKAIPMAIPRIFRAERRAGGTELQQLMKFGMERVALFIERERLPSLVSTV